MARPRDYRNPPHDPRAMPHQHHRHHGTPTYPQSPTVCGRRRVTTNPRHTQPVGWANYALIRDDDAPHQIRIGGGSGGVLWWSCTCQKTSSGNGIGHAYRPLGVISTSLGADAILAAHRDHVAEATQDLRAPGSAVK